MRNMKTMKKHLRRVISDKRGIDTILAALLMVVIVVVASVMVYAWSTGLLGALMVTPQVGKEAMNIENSAFASNSTTVTLYLRNTGSASISLVTYYVKDSGGNQYSRTTWSGPVVPPNQLATTNICIVTACGGAFAPSSFTFTAGNSYTVIVVTSRNSQFTFTATRQ